jgi:hypothetical protein
MQLYSYFVVYPEGETQEIQGHLGINALVDLNGRELALPLKDHRIIAYRVVKMRTEEERGETRRYYFLDVVPAAQLIPYLG